MKLKHILLTIILSIVFLISYAQHYNFTKQTATYTNLTSSTSLDNGSIWDDPNYSIPIGFSFIFYNEPINTIYITDEGLGTFLTTSTFNNWMIPDFADIICRTDSNGNSLSNISYKTEGATGNRILKIEWKNVGYYDDDDNQDIINLQVWMYEGSNIIEYHYGPTFVTNPYSVYEMNSGTSVFIMTNTDYNLEIIHGYIHSLYDAPTNPNMSISQSADSIKNLTAIIPEGTVYTFTPLGSNIPTHKSTEFDFSFLPNPATDYLYLKTNNQQDFKHLKIYSLSGNLVKKYTYFISKIDISDLKPSLYFVEIETKNGVKKTTKLIVK